MVVHASDCSANQCNPIAQQSAKIVTARAMQRTTLTRLETDCRYVNLVLVYVWYIALPRQSSFDFQLQ
jgi:hypothetical protein